MMNMRSLSAGLLMLFLLAGGSVAVADDTTKTSPLDKVKFEGFVRHLLMWGPQIAVCSL